MAQYKYIATNPEGKKLSGIISADNEEEARKELSVGLGFSVLQLQIIEGAHTEIDVEELKKFTKFTFEGVDKSGKKVVGTVPAKDRLAAYKRLIEEYKFTITLLIEADASEKDKIEARVAGVEDLKTQYTATTKKVEKKPSEGVITEAFQEERDAVGKTVDEVLAKTKEFLAAYSGELPPDKLKEIRDELDHLLRIKSSANLDLVKDSASSILKKIQDTGKKDYALETQRLLHNVKRGKKPISVDLEDKFRDDFLSFADKIQKGKLAFLSGPIKQIADAFRPDPELESLKSELKNARQRKKEFLIIWTKSPKEAKKEAWQAYQSARVEEQRIVGQIRVFKAQKRETIRNLSKLSRGESGGPFLYFLGSLLSVSLIFYFVIYYTTFKDLSFIGLSQNFFTFEYSEIIRYLVLLTLVWYAVIEILRRSSKWKAYPVYFTYLVLGVLSIVIVFNI